MYAAGSLIVSIPVVALFLVLSRYLISGLTLGSVKG
jgi:arabinogalactan oligomer/maltooligosaccharide transport system permease protein